MSLKPCLICGQPSKQTRCEDHRPIEAARLRALKAPHRRATDAAPGRWKRLSRRLRKMQPFCSTCGSTRELQVDHVVPIGARPDWAWEVANLDVLCQRCNQLKGSTVPDAEVVNRIAAKISGGHTPHAVDFLSRAKRQTPLHMGIVVNKDCDL